MSTYLCIHSYGHRDKIWDCSISRAVKFFKVSIDFWMPLFISINLGTSDRDNLHKADVDPFP